MARTGASSLLRLARTLDAADDLAPLRRRFAIPRADGRAVAYLCGHSLGLMPLAARAALATELDRWAREAVAAHFGAGGGWFGYHERLARPLARLVGARASEVVAMNSLTVNLHLMLASFFAPQGRRTKILIETDAFPSDRYAVESHLQWHGLDPRRALAELRARDATVGITAEDLVAALRRQRDTVALVVLPGVQYRSGQVLDIRGLVAAAHTHGALIGFDLAHAIGNVPLRLHRWDVDFAVWCSYKYLNGGPGAIGGCFVHTRLGGPEQRRLAGWWGHAKAQRFAAHADFTAIAGAAGWQISNPPIFAMAPLIASLELFTAAGGMRLQRKSRRLTQFMQSALDAELGRAVSVVTPPNARAAQLSLRVGSGQAASAIEQLLDAERVVVDTREPDILRLAPVPLYNRFADVAHAVGALKRVLA